MLASNRETDECVDIARIASERCKEPLLGLDAELGAQFSLDCGPSAGKTLVDAKLPIRGDRGTAACLVQNQDVKRPGRFGTLFRIDERSSGKNSCRPAHK
jgi:hypothetical protein